MTISRFLCIASVLAIASSRTAVHAQQVTTEQKKAEAGDVKVPKGTLLPDQFRWRPSVVPDRIVLSWASDPATSASVNWRTASLAKDSVGQIALATDGPGFTNRITTVVGKPEAFVSNANLSHRHSVEFTNLKPDTQYVYRVGDGANWSEWCQFRTATTDARPFRFVYFGDSQNSLKSMWSRVVRQAFVDAPKAAFFLHAGDLVNDAEKDAEWGQWFYSTGFIHRSTPCLATPGNHEYDNKKLTPQWRPTFSLPQNGPEGLEESCYFLDHQGVRLISLNSNEKHQEQADWLKTVLAENSQPWTIVTYHHPMYSAKAGRDNTELRELWQPLFDKHNVALALQGHDHTYFRSGQMTRETNVNSGAPAANPTSGTVYVVSVSGPKMYDLTKAPFMQRGAEDTQLYQVIDVAGDELSMQAFTATGKLYDSFVIKRRPDGTNQLINKIPDTPENFRPAKPKKEDEKTK